MELNASDEWERGFYQGYTERAQDPNLILALMHAERCAYDAPVPWNNSFLSILQDLRSFTGAVGMPPKMQRAVDRAREIQAGTKTAWAEAWVRTFEEAAEAHNRAQVESTDSAERAEAEAGYFFARQYLVDVIAAAPAPAVEREVVDALAEELHGVAMHAHLIGHKVPIDFLLKFAKRMKEATPPVEAREPDVLDRVIADALSPTGGTGMFRVSYVDPATPREPQADARQGEARDIVSALVGKLYEVAERHNDRTCDYDVCKEVRDARAFIDTPKPAPEDTRQAQGVGADTARLDYIERTFSAVTTQERYLPLKMIWGNGCNGRTLREACDKYMARDAARTANQEQPNV